MAIYTVLRATSVMGPPQTFTPKTEAEVVLGTGDSLITESAFARHYFPQHNSNFSRSGFGFWRLRLPSVRGLQPSGA